MKVSQILIYTVLIAIFAIPVSADLSIENVSVININEKLVWSLDWSPDGKSIAYIAYDEYRNQQLFTINVDGSEEKKITNDTNRKWGVKWFTDELSFMSYQPNGLEKIYFIKPDGSGRRKLLDDDARQGMEPRGEDRFLGGVSWNKAAGGILYTSFGRNGDEKIFWINLDGTGKKQLITDASRQWNPQWSPDGNSFVYVSYDNRSKEQLFIANADGTGKKQITFDEIKKSDLNWGPDGILYLSYETKESNAEKLFLINSDGTNKTLLIKDGFKQSDVKWSPDGTRILYIDIDIQGNQAIKVLNLQKPAVTPEIIPTPITPEATVSPVVTEQTVPPTPAPTAEKESMGSVLFSMFVVLAAIVIVMLAIIAISEIIKKK